MKQFLKINNIKLFNLYGNWCNLIVGLMKEDSLIISVCVDKYKQHPQINWCAGHKLVEAQSP
jgi:hypothetical protein